jgi:hypothetical protein
VTERSAFPAEELIPALPGGLDPFRALSARDPEGRVGLRAPRQEVGEDLDAPGEADAVDERPGGTEVGEPGIGRREPELDRAAGLQDLLCGEGAAQQEEEPCPLHVNCW